MIKTRNTDREKERDRAAEGKRVCMTERQTDRHERERDR